MADAVGRAKSCPHDYTRHIAEGTDFCGSCDEEVSCFCEDPA